MRKDLFHTKNTEVSVDYTFVQLLEFVKKFSKKKPEQYILK